MRPILFLDLDDVLCLNDPYGGYDVLAGGVPDGLWETLFHAPAVKTLLRVIDAYQPAVVLTTSWLRFLDRRGFEELFMRTGLAKVAAALHPTAWEAPQNRGRSRLEAIEAWMSAHHNGEPFVILDDTLSGTGLARSRFDRCGAVVLCEVGVGLTEAHFEAVRRALGAGSRASDQSEQVVPEAQTLSVLDGMPLAFEPARHRGEAMADESVDAMLLADKKTLDS
ncbi:HAD domain-containing protein [Variovorax sp. J22G73]|uniref:HAD domain-containing protein n=1 Tax=unclassified Variovorax TaxID=663243 RepID=UPI0025754633|nr:MULTISPECIES: HAD domain-containing protein [unclassified Variovorax]MDM0010547.1 HAD domain-containing protein [Variovorax sp. J22R203]MDM0102871.1 HAD domain-containing protein [Variovorax sp. J22G73]